MGNFAPPARVQRGWREPLDTAVAALRATLAVAASSQDDGTVGATSAARQQFEKKMLAMSQHDPDTEHAMSTIHLHQTTTSTPEQYVAGLTDFGPGRSKLFRNSADEYLKVHDRGRSQADVTEGSGGVWERLRYDWSDPNRVVLTTTDSNTWGGASGHTYTFTRKPDGTTDIDVVVIRDGKNLKGRMLGFVLGTIGKGVLEKAFKSSVKAIEARNVATGEREGSNRARDLSVGVSGRSP